MFSRIILLLFVFSFIFSGCTTMEDRFMPEDVDKRIIDLDRLDVLPSSQDLFVYPETLSLKRGSTLEVPFGVFNPFQTSAFLVAPASTSVRFGEVSEENILLCKDSRNYDYTLVMTAPLLNVSSKSALAFLVSFNDKNGVSANELTCPVSLFNVDTTKVIDSFDLNISFID